MLSPQKELRRRFTRKKEAKKKILEDDTSIDESDQSDLDFRKNSNYPIIEDEASEPEMISAEEDEEEFGTRDEIPILFRLSVPNGELRRNDQHDDEPTSSGDSVVLSPQKELRRQFTRKEEGKKKILEDDTSTDKSD